MEDTENPILFAIEDLDRPLPDCPFYLTVRYLSRYRTEDREGIEITALQNGRVGTMHTLTQIALKATDDLAKDLIEEEDPSAFEGDWDTAEMEERINVTQSLRTGAHFSPADRLLVAYEDFPSARGLPSNIVDSPSQAEKNSGRIALQIRRQDTRFRKSWRYENRLERSRRIIHAVKLRDRFKRMVPTGNRGHRGRRTFEGPYGPPGVSLSPHHDSGAPVLNVYYYEDDGKRVGKSLSLLRRTVEAACERVLSLLREEGDLTEEKVNQYSAEAMAERVREDLEKAGVEYDLVEVPRDVYRSLYRSAGSPERAPDPDSLSHGGL